MDITCLLYTMMLTGCEIHSKDEAAITSYIEVVMEIVCADVNEKFTACAV